LPADFTPYTAEEVTHFRSDKASDAKTRRDAILAELRSRGLLESGYDPAASALPTDTKGSETRTPSLQSMPAALAKALR
jgi:hypothetical protein